MIGAVLIGYNVLNILSSALATEFITRVVPGRLGSGHRHRCHDRAGGGVRGGAAQDPRHRPRGRSRPLGVRAHAAGGAGAGSR